MISVWKSFAHMHAHVWLFIYSFIFAILNDAVTPCPVFDCKIFPSHHLLFLWRLSIFPCEILSTSPSVSLTRFLSPFLGRLHLSWQLCASSPAIWSDSSHPGAATGAGSLKKSSTEHTYTQPKPSLHPYALILSRSRCHTLTFTLTQTSLPQY